MNELRIDVDCTKAGTWVEIDAVEMVGTRFNFGKFQPNNNYHLKSSIRLTKFGQNNIFFLQNYQTLLHSI